MDSNSKKILGGVAIVGVVGGVGAYALTRKPSAAPPTEAAVLSTSDPLTEELGSDGTVTVNMTINVTQNGSPLSNVTTYLYEGSTQQGASEATDSSGNAKFSFTFTTPGTFTFYGSVA
ncbi:MAG: hypothetical protein ACYDAO_04280 [Thermoplasmataceae archaeon]